MKMLLFTYLGLISSFLLPPAVGGDTKLNNRIYALYNSTREVTSFVNLLDVDLKPNEKSLLTLDYGNEKYFDIIFGADGVIKDKVSFSKPILYIGFSSDKYIMWFPQLKMKSSGDYTINSDFLYLNGLKQGQIIINDSSLTVTDSDSSIEYKMAFKVVLVQTSAFSSFNDLKKKIATGGKFSAKFSIDDAIEVFIQMERQK